MAIEEDPPAGVPEWVVTYGDMMSLLLTFFIMLVSMSEMKTDDGKFRALMDSLEQVFGPEIGLHSSPGKGLPKSSVYDKLASLGSSADGGMLKGNKKSKGPGGTNGTVRKIRDGQVITLGGPVAFDRFSAELSPSALSDLQAIIAAIRDKPNRVEVRGHDAPEPFPPDCPYRDSVDLSFARAHAVDSQAVNRRVDLFLIDAYITAPTEATGGASP